jgi:RNA polymerase sigma-70 factor (ECF subfamily)
MLPVGCGDILPSSETARPAWMHGRLQQSGGLGRWTGRRDSAGVAANRSEDRSGAGLDAAVRRHQAWLVGRIALVVGDREEARDLAQQAFVRAAERWPIGDDEAVARWLAVVGVRLAISERRRRRRWGFLPIEMADSTWALDTDPDLWRALATLDRRTRATMVLTVLEGYSQGEVAEVLGVPRGTLASWLSRARTRLRATLEERD